MSGESNPYHIALPRPARGRLRRVWTDAFFEPLPAEELKRWEGD